MELATAACQLTQWRDASGLESLAASYAEAGNFAAAVELQTKAVELQPGNARALARLEQFRGGKPWRLSPDDLRTSSDEITAALLKPKR